MVRPTGTVTFLLTDVVRSSAQWDAGAADTAAALAQHDAIVRDAAERGTGVVFSTGGDGFAAAFQTAGPAADTAIAIQESLTASASSLRRTHNGQRPSAAPKRDTSRSRIARTASGDQRLKATSYDGVRRTIDTSASSLRNPNAEDERVLCVFWQETPGADAVTEGVTRPR